MNDFFNVMVLAILQGVTEFLPVSSSGHLVIAQSLLKMSEPGLRLVVVLHFGTMFSIIIYYWQVIWRLVVGAFKLDRECWQTIGYIALSAVPAALFYFWAHEKIDALFDDPRSTGGFLLLTGFVLTALRWLGNGMGAVSAGRALLIGLAQVLAILPGVSRSGMTIAAARMAGVSPQAAAEFSFLMCLPLLAGAGLLDCLKLDTAAGTTGSLPIWLLLLGAVVAAMVGYFAIKLLVRVLCGGRFWLFGVYCFLVGLLTILCAPAA